MVLVYTTNVFKLCFHPKEIIKFLTKIWTKNKIKKPGYSSWIHKVKHRGFEPRTTWLKVKCSTDWANAPYKIKNAQNRNRTSDTRIFSPLLYQLSYLGIFTDEIDHQAKKIAGIGFEPMTFGLWARRASRLLHPAISYFCTWFLK